MKIEAIGLTLALAGGTLAGCTDSEPVQRPSPPSPSAAAPAPSPSASLSPPFGPETIQPWPAVNACPGKPGVFTWPGDELPNTRCRVGGLLKGWLDKGVPVPILPTPVRITNLAVGSCVAEPLYLTGTEDEKPFIYLAVARVGVKGADVLVFPPSKPDPNSAAPNPVSVVAKPAPSGIYVTPDNAAVGALVNAPVC